MWVQSLGQEDPLEGMVTHSSILDWRIPMDRGAWWATGHEITKSQTQLKQLKTNNRNQISCPLPDNSKLARNFSSWIWI